MLGATGAVGREFLEQLVESKKLISDPTVAGKRKAVSDLNIDFKVGPNPGPDPSPDPSPNPEPNSRPNPGSDRNPGPQPYPCPCPRPLLPTPYPTPKRPLTPPLTNHISNPLRLTAVSSSVHISLYLLTSPSHLPYQVTALSGSKEMRLSYNGIDPTGDALGESEPADLKQLTEFLEDDYNGNRVVIDCTASQEVRLVATS